jgi:uncharacterized protein with HEPN domain
MLKVKDILHVISLINSFVERENLQSFLKCNLIQSAALRQFEIIGEAGSKISQHHRTLLQEFPGDLLRHLEIC